MAFTFSGFAAFHWGYETACVEDIHEAMSCFRYEELSHLNSPFNCQNSRLQLKLRTTSK
jgi:hypothetical protein